MERFGHRLFGRQEGEETEESSRVRRQRGCKKDAMSILDHTVSIVRRNFEERNSLGQTNRLQSAQAEKNLNRLVLRLDLTAKHQLLRKTLAFFWSGLTQANQNATKQTS